MAVICAGYLCDAAALDISPIIHVAGAHRYAMVCIAINRRVLEACPDHVCSACVFVGCVAVR
jgi:hypothetical protein